MYISVYILDYFLNFVAVNEIICSKNMNFGF